MLVTLAEVKTYLGETSTTYDTFLQGQIDLIEQAIKGYCARDFEKKSYTQKFYSSENPISNRIKLYSYPVVGLTHLKEDGVVLDPDMYRLNARTGILVSEDHLFFGSCVKEIEVVYEAGFDPSDIPAPIKNVVYALCEEKYNKKKSGVALNFGNDVQRISIPGTISIDFDYTLSNNERKNKFGTILGSYLNVLDAYRSERTIGSGELIYVT